MKAVSRMFRTILALAVVAAVLPTILLAGLPMAGGRMRKAPERACHWSFDERAADGQAESGRAELRAAPLDPGATVRYAPGLYGRALDVVAGRGALRVAHHAALDLADEFTVEFVILPRNVRSFRTILFKGDRSSDPERINYLFDIRDGKLEFKTKDERGDWLVFASAPVVKPNEWLQARFSFREGALRLWLNGKEEALTRAESGVFDRALIANTAPALIGMGLSSAGGDPAYAFDGLIDTLTIYRGALDGCGPAEREDFERRTEAYRREAGQRKAVQRAEELSAAMDRYCARGLDEKRAETARGLRLELPQRAEETAEAYDGRLSGLEGRIAALAAGAFYGRFSEADGGPVAMVLNAADRLVKEPFFFRNAMDAPRGTVEIEAARNEYEGFQVVLLAPEERGFERVKAEVCDLVSADGVRKIPAADIEWGWVRDIKTEQPDIPVNFVGSIPDAIVEDGSAFRVEAGSFTPVHVRVRVARDTRPGRYTGQLVFTAGEWRRAVPVALTVRGFTLPERGSLKLAFTFNERHYQEWYGLQALTDDKKRYLYDFLLKYRISPNNIYAGGDTCPERRFLDEYRQRINFFTYGRGGISQPVAREELDKIVAETAEVHEWVRSTGRLGTGYIYLYDELVGHPQSMPGANQLLPALRRAMPDARFMQTSFPVKEVRDLFNVWCPVFSYFGSAERRSALEELRAKGHEIWWYAADNPTKPYPNFFLDYPVFDNRIIMTLSWMYRVDGVLYWCINREWATNAGEKPRWPQGEWKPWIFHARHGTRKYKNGMGNFVYPGADGRLLPSLRLENLRDGAEDYEYLKLLAGGAARLRERRGAPELLARAEAALRVPAEVARAVNDYSSKPEHLLAWRSRMGAVLEELAAAGVLE